MSSQRLKAEHTLYSELHIDEQNCKQNQANKKVAWALELDALGSILGPVAV